MFLVLCTYVSAGGVHYKISANASPAEVQIRIITGRVFLGVVEFTAVEILGLGSRPGVRHSPARYILSQPPRGFGLAVW